MNKKDGSNELLKSIPKGISEKVSNYKLDYSIKRIGIIADLHVPYHSEKVLKEQIKYFQSKKINCLIIDGDFLDFYQISRFLKNPKNPDIQLELDYGLAILTVLRKCFPKVKIIYKLGNHDARLQKFIYSHSELLNLRCLNLENLLELEKNKIELVREKQLIEFGNYIIGHGDEISAGGVNPARLTMLKQPGNIIFGHLHRVDEFQIRNRKEEILKSYSIGCSCQLYPDYWQHNNWHNGLCYCEKQKNGEIKVENIRL